MQLDGVGKGIYQPPSVPVTTGYDLNSVSNILRKQAEEGLPNGSPVIVNDSPYPPAPTSAKSAK